MKREGEAELCSHIWDSKKTNKSQWERAREKRPVPHSITLPVPSLPNESDIDTLSDSFSTSLTNSNNYSEISNSHDAEEDSNELVKDLYLPEKKAELLASRLKQLNLL